MKSMMTEQAIVGGSLIGGGALLTGIGTSRAAEQALSLSIAGASLITAGIICLLAAAAISSRQRIIVGVVLTMVGTTVAALGTGLDANAVVAVALTGGSLLTAGVVQILLGTTHQRQLTTSA